MTDIDPFAAAGSVVTAFVAGSSIFYLLGRNSEHRRLERELEHKTKDLGELNAKTAKLNEELDTTRSRILDMERNRVPPPPKEQANQLVQTLLRDEDDVWLSEPIQKPRDHDDRIATLGSKIISIANLKGGVGKTTTTANLAAYFDLHQNKRVLVIDADYQGSLSAILNRMARTSEPASTTARWLEGVSDFDGMAKSIDRVGNDLPKTKYLSSFYELSNVETRLMVQWLLTTMLQEKGGVDLRYALSRILHSHAIQSRFDVILIDCPPRLSTATINALCASTHLLIPTVPDNSSLEAVANFLKMYRRVTARLNHNINLLGVAPTLTLQSKLTQDEANSLEKLSDRVRLFGGGEPPYIFQNNIPRNLPIARLAGQGIALVRAPAPTKKLFKDFGAEVASRLEPSRTQRMQRVAAE